jgi:hypothetical protein
LLFIGSNNSNQFISIYLDFLRISSHIYIFLELKDFKVKEKHLKIIITNIIPIRPKKKKNESLLEILSILTK